MWEIPVCSCQEQRSELQLVGLGPLMGLAAANYHAGLDKSFFKKKKIILLTLASICIHICCVTNVCSVHLSLSWVSTASLNCFLSVFLCSCYCCSITAVKKLLIDKDLTLNEKRVEQPLLISNAAFCLDKRTCTCNGLSVKG